MAKTLDKSNLGYLGIDFQYKLVKYFVEDHNFFEEVYDIVDQNAFSDINLRIFVGTLKDIYKKENIAPSYSTIELVLRSKANDEYEIKEWEELIEKLKKTSYEGSTLVKENALKFFKQQKLIKAANKILEKVGKGDIEQYEECLKIMEDALSTGNAEDYGKNIFELEEKALSDDYTVSVSTGISGLDEALGGGLDKGKFGLIIGPLGFGKTTLATAMASAAATTRCEQNNNQGWKVVQIYFEDDDVDITRKHFSRLVDREAREFKRLNKDDRKVIFESLENHPDRELLTKNLRIKSFRTGEKSATDIKNWLIKLTNKGFKPDLVIIDYFECLAPERDDKSKDKWESEGITARKIEGMAKELNIAVWVPTQGSRDSIVAEIVTVDKGGGSIKKSQVAQVIISIARTLEDRENNRATLALLKNRSGLGTKIFKNIKFDNGRSIVVCDEVEELDSLKQWDEEQKKINQRNQEEMVIGLHEKYQKNCVT